jgi:Protein of unknown function (DUF3592)
LPTSNIQHLTSGFDSWVVGGASVFLLLGGWIFGLGARNVWRALASPAWPTSPGIVVSSETGSHVTTDRRTRTNTRMYSADIRFKYQANGRDYTTDTLHFGQTVGSGDSSDAELRHARYPVGAAVAVSYNPKDPSIAAVEPGFDSDVLWLPGAGLAFFVPGVMFIVLFFGITRGSGLFGLGLGMFAGIFAAIGISLLAGGLVNLWRAHASQGWPQTAGVIVYGVIEDYNSEIKDTDGDTIHSTSSGAHLIYRYELDGKKHYSNVRRFGQLAAASGDWASDIAARYPPGKAVRVAYSPGNYDLAVLEPGIDRETFWLPAAGAAFLLFGLAVFIWGIPALT